MSTISKGLLQVKSLLEKGWCQNFNQKGDQYCIRGAIMSVFRESPNDVASALTYVERAIVAINPKENQHQIIVPCFNDSPSTNHKLVLQVIVKAIELSKS